MADECLTKPCEMKSLHDRIVKEVLPQFAERLKKEGVISSYDRKSFMIQVSKDKHWAPIRIKPDLVLHLPDMKRVLIEIANPKDPKRFIGEIVYPQILGYHNKVAAAIVFVLHHLRKDLKHDRAFTQQWILDHVLRKQIHVIGISWPRPGGEDVAYRNLKAVLTTQKEWLFPKES